MYDSTQMKDVLLARDIWATKHYAIAMGGIMGCFIVCHWLNITYFRYGQRKSGPIVQSIWQFQRMAQRLLNNVILSTRLDKLLIYLLYWTINCILLLTNPIWEILIIGKRFGWMTVANLTLLVFLSLRNTPLAPLSGNSYEKLRPLHKVAGYTTIFSALIHGLISVITYHEHGHIDKFKQPKNFAGSIAGLCLLIMGISSMRWFIRRNYEAFYMIHVAFFMLVIIALGLHRTDFAESTIKINIFIACLWFTDRLFRLAKTCWNFVGNFAILTPMADGTVRVKLRRSLACRPGSHAFLWIPSIRLLETHPFTLVSSSPSEFLIREYDGFTSSLVKAARENPGKAWRCSVDGGYGRVPDFERFDRVILVAGGSGATFTFSIASSIVRKEKAQGTTVHIDFIWVVRYSDCLNWFAKELKELQQTPFVNLIIYVTRNNVISEDTSSPEMIEANGSENVASPMIGDIEKGQKENDKEAISAPEFQKGRPDISYLLTECLSRCSIEDRVGVGACGPSDLLDYAREAVSRREYDHGPSITFHSEVNPLLSGRHSVQLFTDSRLGLPLVKWKFANRDQNIPLGSFSVVWISSESGGPRDGYRISQSL